MSDFKVGDRVKTIDGREGIVNYIEQYEAMQPMLLILCNSGAKQWYFAWQLTKVEPPKPSGSPWLLTEEQRLSILEKGRIGHSGSELIALAAARHLVEELQRRGADAASGGILLYGQNWEDLKRAVGLLRE